MHSPAVEAVNKPTTRLATCIVLLWLAGNGLRLTILAVPPLIPLIHDDLRMSETQVGLLAGLPVFLFALAALSGSLLTARFGAVAAVLVGLVVTATGTALRAIVPAVAALYAATFVNWLRSSRHAAGDAFIGSCVAAEAYWPRHRDLCQWSVDRRDTPGLPDAASRAAGSWRQLATRACGLGRTLHRHCGDHPLRRPADSTPKQRLATALVAAVE
jgi:hypothetical protein